MPIRNPVFLMMAKKGSKATAPLIVMTKAQGMAIGIVLIIAMIVVIAMMMKRGQGRDDL